MTRYDPSVKCFLRQIKYDKDYAVKMINENFFWCNAVNLVYEKSSILYAFIEPDTSIYQEFIEFIEGNGYRVIRNKDSRYEGIVECEIIAE